MDSQRSILNTRFADLYSDTDKKKFIFALLNLSIINKNDQHIVYLNQQYHKDFQELEAIKLFLENNPSLFKTTANYDGLLEDITIVLHTPLILIEDYKELRLKERKQFIFALLHLNNTKRKECLTRQSIDAENIILLQTHLLSEWIHIFIDLPDYQDLVNAILDLNKSLQPVLLKHAIKTNVTPATNVITNNTELDQIYADIKELFEDPILYNEIKIPKITPQGTTYDETCILQAINRRINAYEDRPLRQDPYTRKYLDASLLLPNHLFTSIKNLFLETPSSNAKERLYEYLVCSLSHQPFVHPVVAENGLTYEHDYIEAYLDKHKMQLPDGTKQIKALYPNRFIINLLEVPSIKIFINKIENSLNILRGRDGVECVNQLLFYNNMRVKEENFAGWGNFCKWDKLSASIATVDAIDKKINIHTFFANTNHLNALKQGRLKTFAEPALNYLAGRAVKA